MATYTIACMDCQEMWDIHVPMAKRDEPQLCPHCDSYECTKRIIQPISFTFAEVDKAGDSSKPDSYWNNAEREKQKRIAAEQNKVMEQAYYNDPNLPTKHQGLKERIK
jgi:hypothetical protein